MLSIVAHAAFAGLFSSFLATTAPSFAATTMAIPAPGVIHEVVGEGRQPDASSVVRVHYKGTLATGEVFDSSWSRGEPAQFSLGGVIPCWTVALQQMKEGGRARISCPSPLAYGERGIPGVIPPQSTLYFEVELLEVR